MGGGGKQTIGYRYFLGMHMALSHGPVDALLKIRVDDKLAWKGRNEGEQLYIDNEGLFGGDKREGGVSGFVDVEMGRSDQLQNDYLVGQLGSEVPAYRGVFATVLRQVYTGINPYLKKWSFEAQRVYTKTDGTSQWAPDIAGIGSVYDFNDTAVWIASDDSGSMSFAKVQLVSQGLQRLFTVWEETEPTERSDLFIRQWSDAANSNYQVNDISTTEQFQAVKDYVGTWTGGNGGTLFSTGLDGALDFFNNSPCSKKIMLFLTDGGNGTFTDEVSQIVDLTAAGVQVFVFNIQDTDITDSLVIDNTAFDSVPVISDLADVDTYLLVPFGNGLDANPAHVIRECLTNSEWGMGYQDSDIDETSFRAAAERYFVEKMGISLLWDKGTDLETFIQEVLRHVDSALSVSRSTGLFILTPIRSDYVVQANWDESNISEVQNPNILATSELSNSVTVKFFNRINNRDDAVTVSDTAMIQTMGENINANINYVGFTNRTNALKAAWRDLKALSTPFFSCTLVVADQNANNVEVGDVILFSWAEWNIVEMPLRINKISYGDGIDNRIRFQCTEDIYSTPTVVPVTSSVTQWTDPSQPPVNVQEVTSQEVPYVEVVKFQGQLDTDTKLAADPDIGYVFAAAARPSFAINATMWRDDGAGYTDVDILDFSPFGKLRDSLDYTTTTMKLSDSIDLSEVVVGEYFMIGEGRNDTEFCRVDSVDVVNSIITMGRGCYDTPPKKHLSGSSVFFFQQYYGVDENEHVTGETINVKVTPISGSGSGSLLSAEEVSTTLDQRAYRPFSPGDFQVNANSYDFSIDYTGILTITWVGRDRTQQTTGTIQDHTAGNIGPEVGVTYRVRGYLDDVLEHTEDPAVSGTTWTPSGAGLVRVEVDALRDGVYSYQPASFEFLYGGGNARVTEDGVLIKTEENDLRLTED